MARFGTIEVYEELATVLADDPEWADAGARISQTIVFSYTEPVSKSFFLRFEAGRVTEVSEVSGDADADFLLTASPDTWRDILTGQLNPVKAVMGGSIEFQGSTVALLKQMKPFNTVLAALSRIDME